MAFAVERKENWVVFDWWVEETWEEIQRKVNESFSIISMGLLGNGEEDDWFVPLIIGFGWK